MKLKAIQDRKTHENCLTARLAKGEELDYIEAEQLHTLQAGPFLPFSYETEKDDTTVLSYDISDTIELGTYLGARLSHRQFRTLMTDVAYAVEACADNGFSYTEFVFDSQFVFVDAETNHLKLAYIPATQPNSKRATITDLLRFIATRTKFVCKEDTHCAAGLLDFLKRQTIFSLVDFKAFIDSGELKSRTGDSVSLRETSVFSDQAGGEQESSNLASSPSSSSPLSSSPLASSPLGSGELKTTFGETGAYDFVKAQAGTPSAEETRASKNLAEQISFDVADVASAPTGNTGGATWEEVTSLSEPLTSPGSSAPQAQTLFIVRVSTGERYSLPYLRETSIGRSKRCDVRIGDNTNISRVHAMLEANDKGCLITDQGATNKTSVGGKELSPHVPQLALPGDEILLADERFRLEAK